MSTKHIFQSSRWLLVLASLSLAASLLALSLALMAGLAYAQAGSISGTVTYYGGIPGTYNIWVAVFTGTGQPPVASTGLSSPGGTYTVSGLADGTYYVNAYLDVNDSGGPPDDGEPWAWYDPDGDGNPDPVVVAGGGAVTGIDIALSGPWLPTGGPTIAGGQVGALAVHPAVSGSLYTAVQPPDADWDIPSTIYKSTNGAANWAAMYTAPHRIRGLAVTDTVIYAGAYNRDEWNPQPVIYRSTDGGLNWTTPLSIADGTIHALDIHPTLTQTAVAGGGDYPDKAMLYQTTDGGLTWTEIFSYTKEGWYPTVNAVLIHPTIPSTMLLSHDGEVDGTFGSYILHSTDGGVTWTEVYTITEDLFTSLIVNPVTPTTIYASTWQNNFYRSTGGGLTWSAVVTDGSAGERLVLDPPNTLYAVRDNELLKSTDEGDSWGTVSYAPEDVRSLAIDLDPTPSALYVGLERRGVYKSTNGGADWEERNNGIETAVQPRDIDVDPQNPDKMFAAAECSGGWMTTDGGKTWTEPSNIAGCMGSFAINPEDPNVVYGGEYNNNRGAVGRSEDGGLTFETVYTAPFILPDGSGGDECIYTLAIAPSISSTVYAAGRDRPAGQDDYAVVVRSLDDGASWTEVFTLPPRSYVEALSISPADDDIVYAGGQDCSGPDCVGFIYRTTDGGDNWTRIFTPDSTVRSIVVDYQKPNVLYASADNYEVYKSTDSGDSWFKVRECCPSGKYLAIDPHVPSHVYLGGWGYIAETTDGGQTWSEWEDPINQGTPEMELRALTVDNGTVTQTLYAGFSGVWAYSRLAPQPGGPATVTASADPMSAPTGSTSKIRALVVDEHENWVADGTEVTFITTLGLLDGSTTITKTTTNGVATATLLGTTAGTATVIATADGRSDTTTVEFTRRYIYLPLVVKSYP